MSVLDLLKGTQVFCKTGISEPRLALTLAHQLRSTGQSRVPHGTTMHVVDDGPASRLEDCTLEASALHQPSIKRENRSKANSLRPDVIVTDISMPVLSGIDAVHKLRESGCAAVFVFLTIHSEKEFVDACLGAGALGYVQKRYMKRQLVPAIQAALAGQSYVSQSDLAP
jgi:CheY-like chemotaxis protein